MFYYSTKNKRVTLDVDWSCFLIGLQAIIHKQDKPAFDPVMRSVYYLYLGPFCLGVRV